MNRFKLVAAVHAMASLVVLAGVAHAAEPLDCKITGLSPFAKGVQIFDAASGGKVIGVFSGVLTPATMTALPAEGTMRARVSTSAGTPAFRIDGWVAANEVPLYTNRPVSVIGAHVAIASHQAVRFLGANAQGIRIEHSIGGSQNQVLATTATCDSLALGPVAYTPELEPGKPYRMKVTSLELRDAPRGNIVFTLNMLDGVTLLLWKVETRAGYLHIRSVSDVILDAWVKPRGLEPLRAGELAEPYETPMPKGAVIGFNQQPSVVVAKRDIPIRASHEPEAPIIGAIEAGTEVYLIANVEGWASVMPKSLAIKASDEWGFWVPERDVMP